jgi:hypothetical protein
MRFFQAPDEVAAANFLIHRTVLVAVTTVAMQNFYRLLRSLPILPPHRFIQ